MSLAVMLAVVAIQTAPDQPQARINPDHVEIGNWTFDRKVDSFSGQTVCTATHKGIGEPKLTAQTVDRFFVISGFMPFEMAEIRVNGQNVQTMTALSYFGRERELVRQLNLAGGLVIQQADLPKIRTLAVRIRGTIVNIDFGILNDQASLIPAGC